MWGTYYPPNVVSEWICLLTKELCSFNGFKTIYVAFSFSQIVKIENNKSIKYHDFTSPL